MQNDYALNSILNAHINDIYIYIQLLISNKWFYNLIFLYFSIAIYEFLLSLIYFNYHLPFPITSYHFGYNKLLPYL